MIEVQARQNDTLDALCWRHLGVTAGVVEQALQMNPGLAEHGPILPTGTRVQLPEAEPLHPVDTTVKLWD